jgi:hypothetical protein
LISPRIFWFASSRVIPNDTELSKAGRAFKVNCRKVQSLWSVASSKISFSSRLRIVLGREMEFSCLHLPVSNASPMQFSSSLCSTVSFQIRLYFITIHILCPS